MQDIAVTRAYRLTKLRWWINYVNNYEELYPHLSRDKAFSSSINSIINKKVTDEEVTKKEGQQQGQKQPSFVEKLRYNFLTLFFKKPKESDAIINDDPYYFDYNNNDEIRTNITDGTVDLEKIMNHKIVKNLTRKC